MKKNEGKMMDKKEAEKILVKIKKKYDMDCLINNSPEAPKKLRDIISKLSNLWFVYGNNGKKHTYGNHRFIQKIINIENPEYDFSNLTDMEGVPSESATKECKEKVDSLIKKMEAFCE